MSHWFTSHFSVFQLFGPQFLSQSLVCYSNVCPSFVWFLLVCNNNNNNIIYIALYTKVLKRFTMEGGTGIIKTYIT